MEQSEAEVSSEAGSGRVREVYTLSMGLRNGSRCVEDSYRAGHAYPGWVQPTLRS